MEKTTCTTCRILRALSRTSTKVSRNLHSARFSTDPSTGKTDWKEIYRRQKLKVEEDFKEPVKVNPHAVFANNETSLQEIDIYGFDYDYTLASYKSDLHELIYNLGRENLIYKYKYPEEVAKTEYCHDFAVRGCHYDVRKGLLMKLDSFHNIQLGTVYRGSNQLSDACVKTLYNGIHVSLQDMNTFYGTGPMYQLVDLFAYPEMTLLCNVTDFLMDNGIPYDPEYVFHDVRKLSLELKVIVNEYNCQHKIIDVSQDITLPSTVKIEVVFEMKGQFPAWSAVQGVHSSGLLHNKIMENLEKYLEKDSAVKLLLETLVGKGKKLFLITNSGFPFIDAGMKFMVGEGWRDLFDVIITKARKPKFFNESKRPFRIYDPSTHDESWDRVTQLVKGKVYQQGNFYMLQTMTGWYSFNVLYFGDHVYSDLADPSLKHGWRTGAIIPELEEEIRKSNTLEYQSAVRWLCVLQDLIENAQMDNTQDTSALCEEWLRERNEIRNYTKALFNARFGSIFRTYHNPTYFSRRMSRFADLYMSSIVNLLNYPTNHTFYPRRMELPHEPHIEPRG